MQIMIDKFNVWYAKVGLTNVLFLVGAIAGFIQGWNCLATASAALFIYINWNSIRKIIDK